jgi:hypothetical protein
LVALNRQAGIPLIFTMAATELDLCNVWIVAIRNLPGEEWRDQSHFAGIRIE